MRRTIGNAVVGGTASELSGGKFANGAFTAALLTVGEAFSKWAPSSDGNDPVEYAAQVVDWTGISVNTAMNTLTTDEIDSFANAIKRYEEWAPGNVSITRAPLRERPIMQPIFFDLPLIF